MSVNYYIVEQAYAPISYEGFDNAVVIIGHANKGPSMLPVYLSDTEYVEFIFGTGSELANACLECFYAGAEKIIAIRINGTYSTATLDDADGAHLMKLYSINAGNTGSTIRAEIATVDTNKTLTIYEAGSLLQRTYILNDTSISSLCAAINRDVSFGYIGVAAEPINDTAASNTLADTPTGGTFLTGGTDEAAVTGETLYERLEALYAMLEIISFDILIPMPVKYTDYIMPMPDEKKYFYNQLKDFCEIKADEGRPITVIISCDDFDPETHVNMAIYAASIEDKVTNATEIERSQYISVVRSWITTPYTNTDGSGYVSRGDVLLGGLLNTLGAHINPMNKPIGALFGIYSYDGLRYEFSADQTKRLADIGISSFHSSIRRGVSLTGAVTSALASHSCHSIKNARLSNYIVKTVSAVLDNYIGSAAVNQYSSINKTLDGILLKMVTDNVIKDYKYTVVSDRTGENLSIDIEAIPLNDIKTVSATIMVHV